MSLFHFTDKNNEALKGLQVTEQEPKPKFLSVLPLHLTASPFMSPVEKWLCNHFQPGRTAIL